MSELNDHSCRAHALLSASSAHRWLNCPPSAVAAELYPQQDTEYTREGTLAHEVAEAVARCGDAALAHTVFEDGVTGEMIDCAQSYSDYIQEQIKSDKAIVLLEQRVDFSHWVPDGFGTCDCIIIQDDVLNIIDYKYGQGVPVSAEDNPQMKLYALGALNDYGIAYDIHRVEMHIYQPRINNVSDSSLMVEDLLEWAEKTVKPTAEKASKGKGKYSAGSWCTFCPHAGRCRELAKSCTEIVNVNGLQAPVERLAPHEVSDILAKEPLISLWLKRVKQQALTDLMNGKEVPGYKVVEGRAARDWVDELKVAERLRAADYSMEDITKTELLSPAAMEKAIGKKKVAELLTDLVEKKAGAPTIASASDKRPAYSRTDDFEVLA